MIRLLLFFVLFSVSISYAQNKFEYAFKVGDEYTLTQTTKQTIKQSVMGMEQNTTSTYDSKMQLKVTALTSTGARLETQFIQLKNLAKSPMGDVNIDSEGPAETGQNKIFKSMMNKPFFILMSKTGSIEKIENVENLWSGFKDLGMDESASSSLKQSMEQLLGKDALKGSFEQAFIIYSTNKVKPGETWVVTTGAPLNFPLKIENKYTLENLEKATARITADGAYTTTDKEKIIDLPGGLKSKIDLSGQQAIKANADAKTAWPTTLDVLAELKGKMTILAGGMIPEDMDIPMEVLVETSYTIQKK